MEKESLIEIRKRIIQVIESSNINPLDKAEFLINMCCLLESVQSYDEAIKILMKTNKKHPTN